MDEKLKAETFENNALDDEHAQKQEKAPRIVWIKTIALVFVWISMGMSHAIAGSTIPDMRVRLDVNTEEYSRTFTAMSVGGMIGAPLGVFADRHGAAANGIISLCLFTAATVLALRPWSMYLWVLTILSFIEGVAWTCLNSIGNSMIMVLWGDAGNAPMHLLHFGYPVGAVIGPLIAALYVSDEQQYTNETTTVLYDVTMNEADESRFADGSQIEIAYGIGAVIVAANGIVFILFQLLSPHSNQSIVPQDETNQPETSWKEVLSPTKWGSGDKRFGLTIVILVMVFYFLLVATFKASTTYYVTYSVDSHLEFTNSESAIYNSFLGIAGATGRACSIFVAQFLAIQVMLFVEVYGMVAATILMAFWGHKSTTPFWICSMLVLFFRDPIWPSIMTWTDKYIVLYAIVVGLSDMASKTSDAIFAWVLGYMYTYVNMESIFYFSVIFGVLLCVLVIIMHIIATRHGGRYDKESVIKDVNNTNYDIPEMSSSCIDLKNTDSNCNLVKNEHVEYNIKTEATYL